MIITTSYAIEIKHVNKIFRQTIKIYQSAISYCIKVFEENWESLKKLNLGNKEQASFADKLIHSTKTNIAKYSEFDKKFYKMPVYLRLAVINVSLGHLNSYHNNNTIINLVTKINSLPTFYRYKMYKNNNFQNNSVQLKLFVNNDWNWIDIKLNSSDIKSIQKRMVCSKMSVPTLEKRNKKWFLRFTFMDNVKLKDIEYKKQKILSVDLGINTDATCSVMLSDGTILARKFINFASDKDLILHTLNKIKKIQQKYRYKNTNKLWRYVNFHNTELARKISNAIINLTVKYDCDIIVFEYLDIKGKIKCKNKQKVSLWKKITIQKLITVKAHKLGIRIASVNANNTSKLAYDGSGKVKRGKEADFDTFELCKFQSGKIYNCDLSASYNIGARYFIRCIEKSISVTKWSYIQAKVPDCMKRTNCTYSTLLKILEYV